MITGILKGVLAEDVCAEVLAPVYEAYEDGKGQTRVRQVRHPSFSEPVPLWQQTFSPPLSKIISCEQQKERTPLSKYARCPYVV